MKLNAVLVVAIGMAFGLPKSVRGQVPSFATPERIVTRGVTWGSVVTGNGLEMYFTDWNDGEWELSKITRPTSNTPWQDSSGEHVNELNSFAQEDEISFTPDGLRAVFTRGSQIYESSRNDLTSRWGEPRSTELNGWAPDVSGDGLSVYYTDNMWNDSGADIHFATRDSLGEPFEPAGMVEGINTPTHRESSPSVTSDGLRMFFVSDRPGGYGLEDIWTASRPSIDVPFGEASNLGPEINSAITDWSPFVANDGVLYYTRDTLRGDCCWDIYQALPSDRYQQIGGEGLTGRLSLEGEQADMQYSPLATTQSGLLQRWYSVRNPTTLGRAFSRIYDPFFQDDNIDPDVPPFVSEDTWWAAPSHDLTAVLSGYPAVLAGAERSNDRVGGLWNSENNEHYTVALTGQIKIPESGTYRFIDGVDDFVAFGIDTNTDGIVDEAEFLILDNQWTGPTRDRNDGGYSGDDFPAIEFSNIPVNGEWFEVLAFVADSGGLDSGVIYWDYDASDHDGDGVRIGDAKGFPANTYGEGRTIAVEDIPSLVIPNSYLRTEGAFELVEGSILAQLNGNLLGYQLEITSEGEHDQILLEDPTGKLQTRLDLNDATLSLSAIGDPKPGEYQLLVASEIFGEAQIIVPDDVASIFDTSRLLSEGVLSVIGNSFDCNGDGLLTILDMNCTAAENVSLAIQELGILPGDANGDGNVAFDDFLALSANFGQRGGYTAGDFDGNGEIGFPDFLLLSSNFGKALSITAVPEPSNYYLSVAICLLGLLHRRRKGSLHEDQRHAIG